MLPHWAATLQAGDQLLAPSHALASDTNTARQRAFVKKMPTYFRLGYPFNFFDQPSFSEAREQQSASFPQETGVHFHLRVVTCHGAKKSMVAHHMPLAGPAAWCTAGELLLIAALLLVQQ